MELVELRVPRRRSGVGGDQAAARPRAPAIGIAAAYGVVRRLQTAVGSRRRATFFAAARRSDRRTSPTSRPTAVNLFWALDRMKAKAAVAARQQLAGRNSSQRCSPKPARSTKKTARCAAPSAATARSCWQIGSGVLTHCNAGGLATADYGTALAVLFTCQDQGKQLHVFVDETRPLLQGARLTAWELAQRGIDATLICDTMAGQVMREGKVQAVIVGADRIAANGDTANKIGTYSRRRPRRGPRHSVLRRRPVQHVRPVARLAATRFRSSSAPAKKSPTASAGRPPPTASASTIPPSTSRPPG